jgi:hypothetical protein
VCSFIDPQEAGGDTTVAVTKPRNKVLIFRLTQDEYQALQTASTGARSLSDFARTKLLGSLDSPGAPAFGQQLLELKSSVARIAELLEKES